MGHKNKHKYNGNNMNQKPQADSPEELKAEEQMPQDAEVEEVTPEEVTPEAEAATSEAENEYADAQKKIAELEAAYEEKKKEYLFLMAEFDNFRKRTLKEKSEIIKNGGENVLKGLLPIMDDFERGLKAAEASPEAESVKEGLNLIYNKFKNYLSQNGVKELDPVDDNFDTEKHEAISVVPVADEEKKGKILDTVEKGYTINDKVLRHAKVVVGQ